MNTGKAIFMLCSGLLINARGKKKPLFSPWAAVFGRPKPQGNIEACGTSRPPSSSSITGDELGRDKRQNSWWVLVLGGVKSGGAQRGERRGGGESGRERAAVSLNGKDRLSLQLSLITFPTILFSVSSPSPEQAEEAWSVPVPRRRQRGSGFRLCVCVCCPCGLGSWWGPAGAGRDTAARPAARTGALVHYRAMAKLHGSCCCGCENEASRKEELEQQ